MCCNHTFFTLRFDKKTGLSTYMNFQLTCDTDIILNMKNIIKSLQKFCVQRILSSAFFSNKESKGVMSLHTAQDFLYIKFLQEQNLRLSSKVLYRHE